MVTVDRPVVAVCVNNEAAEHVRHVRNSVVANGGEISFLLVAHPNVPEDLLSQYADEGIEIHRIKDWKEIDTNRLRCRCPLRTQAVYYRWLLPELVDSDRVIYMDHDVIVTGDVKELWEMPLGDNYVAMARDPFNKTARQTWSFFASGSPLPDMDLDVPAMQSGLMVINSVLWRRDHIKDRLVQLYDHSPMNDQLAISILLAGRIVELDDSWAVPVRYCDENWYCRKTGKRYADPKYLHWHGPPKPWKDPVPYRELYEKYI